MITLFIAGIAMIGSGYFFYRFKTLSKIRKIEMQEFTEDERLLLTNEDTDYSEQEDTDEMGQEEYERIERSYFRPIE